MGKSGKNVHLEHLEDEIINMGADGGVKAIKVLQGLGQFMTGAGEKQMAVTTKWDGAPAVICGTDPSDGKFFVGTKSVFSQTPKLCKTPADVRSQYSGALQEKLLMSLEHFAKLDIKGVLQGDLMFTNDKQEQKIQGEDFITFRPNTITYAARMGSELQKKISKSKIGIVFHTKYTGNTLAEMQSSFSISDNDFTKTEDVWVEKAEFKDIGGMCKFSTAERQQYDRAINRASGSLRQASATLNAIQSGKKTLQIDTEFKKFFNSYVREGREIPSVSIAYNEFLHHMGKEYDKKIKPLKTLKSQEKKVSEFVNMVRFFENNERGLKMVIASYMNIQFCKRMIVKKMKKVTSLNLFVDMGGGDYRVTTPEGFVAITSQGAIKLVDRLEFSRLNFVVPKIW
jgi:hypothetical protein